MLSLFLVLAARAAKNCRPPSAELSRPVAEHPSIEHFSSTQIKSLAKNVIAKRLAFSALKHDNFLIT
jgi:hypothetical protein